jgi:hypothetical protein
MYRYFSAVIERFWLAFLVAGLASLYVGALGKSPYSGDVLSNNYSGPVLMAVGILLIASSIFFIVKKELAPPMPDPADLKLPAIDADEYGLKIKKAGKQQHAYLTYRDNRHHRKEAAGRIRALACQSWPPGRAKRVLAA